MEEWKEYFMELMGGMENKVVKGDGGGNRHEEEEIELEEVRNVIKKLKTGKAIGRDGIPNEVWKFGGEEMIYTAVLAERIRKEVETKNLIPGNQAGFRKGMGTMDQIFALNYLVNRQLGKEKGKMTVMFVDLKAAFDSVDKEVLLKAMKERGVRQGLIDRVEEVLRETKSSTSRSL
ncbi:uncharacterized protein [Temnothorax nylanderi]|uniref:uncharacterized protein n=1 Tax=Temnothorax nylanderi TaxID=102681 RepID=UPI003A879B6F